jgi:hypothetical protein
MKGMLYMQETKGMLHVDRSRIMISNPEQYDRVEIRSLAYDDSENIQEGYNGNVIVGYGKEANDIFFLSINNIKEDDLDAVCDKIEGMFAQDGKPINLMIYNGESTIYNLNEQDNSNI